MVQTDFYGALNAAGAPAVRQ